MAARQEASGADPEYLATDRPSAVSENGGDESRLRKRTCRQRYQGMAGSLKHQWVLAGDFTVERRRGACK